MLIGHIRALEFGDSIWLSLSLIMARYLADVTDLGGKINLVSARMDTVVCWFTMRYGWSWKFDQ